MDDDCWLPGLVREVSAACKNASLTGCGRDVEKLRNGIDRPTDKEGDNGAYVSLSTPITYTFTEPCEVKEVRIIFDSDLDRVTLTGGIPEINDCPTVCNRPFNMPPYTFPSVMVREFVLEVDGKPLYHIFDNCQRLVRLKVNNVCSKISLTPISTYGAPKAHIFSFDFK